MLVVGKSVRNVDERHDIMSFPINNLDHRRYRIPALDYAGTVFVLLHFFISACFFYRRRKKNDTAGGRGRFERRQAINVRLGRRRSRVCACARLLAEPTAAVADVTGGDAVHVRHATNQRQQRCCLIW